MTPLIREMVALVPNLEPAHWFDLGIIDKHVPAVHLEWDKARHMPYPRTYCVFKTVETGTKYAVFLLPGSNSITVGYVAQDPGRPPLYSGAVSIIELNGELKYKAGSRAPKDERAVKNVARVLAVVAQRIHGERTAYKPERIGTAAQQAKRARHGKTPLFDWHTVAITPVQPESHTAQGGHHASPRLHDRRGHWRTYPSGKRGWVKSCQVGDASRGVIFKDYEVRT